MDGPGVTIEVAGAGAVSGEWVSPPSPAACLVLAHGAGAGMRHPFLTGIAQGLAERGVATLRYNFPYMERGSRRPDPPALAHQAVRAAVAVARSTLGGVPLFAGGKSFGGRMTSQAQAAAAMPGVRGLAFLGFPLHPPGKPAVERGVHLSAVGLPMLFLQGTRDEFAEAGLMAATVAALGPSATTCWFAGADHAFRVPARSTPTGAQLREELLDRMAEWIGRIAAGDQSH